MKSAFISDLHIKTIDDLASQKLIHFFNDPIVNGCEEIYFLGDIFEYMVGEHEQYTKKYFHFFEGIEKFINDGKKVYFFEGNHDFHFENTVMNYLTLKTLNPKNFFYSTKAITKTVNNQKVLICHGYEIDFYNISFKRWHAVYTSWWMKVFLTYFLPFSLLQKIGEIASKDSKRRGRKTFDFQKMKERYRTGAQALIKERGIQGVIGGHTHIPEFKIFENGTFYYNVGYPTRDNHYLYFNGDDFERKPLS